MNFGLLMAKNFTDPEPSYEFTREKFVKTVNQYVSGAFGKNLKKSQFGLQGTIEFPPAGPQVYKTPPSPGIMSGQVIAYNSGKVTKRDYDSVAKRSQKEIGSFWPNFFELIGKAFLRTKYEITPVTEVFGAHTAQYSTPLVVTATYLESSGSYFKRTGNTYSKSKVLSEWRSAGKSFSKEVIALKVEEPKVLQDLLGKRVREAATRASLLYINYTGTIKFGNMTQPGLFKGLIYGKMKFD